MLLNYCWAPCFTLNKKNQITLESGSYLIAFYTGLLHVFSFLYFIYLYANGPSDAFYSPLFEYNLNSVKYLCILLSIYSLIYIFSSFLLYNGIKKEIRFYYWPWLLLTTIEIGFLFSFGYFMVYRYYHYGWAIFAWLLIWIYSLFHVYIFYAIISQYYYLKKLQEPTFIILMP